MSCHRLLVVQFRSSNSRVLTVHVTIFWTMKSKKYHFAILDFHGSVIPLKDFGSWVRKTEKPKFSISIFTTALRNRGALNPEKNPKPLYKGMDRWISHRPSDLSFLTTTVSITRGVVSAVGNWGCQFPRRMSFCNFHHGHFHQRRALVIFEKLR